MMKNLAKKQVKMTGMRKQKVHIFFVYSILHNYN